MTALKQEVLQIIDRLPEEKFPYLIQFVQKLEMESENRTQELSPKMKAFQELETMLVPGKEEFDYGQELAKARDEKYGNID